MRAFLISILLLFLAFSSFSQKNNSKELVDSSLVIDGKTHSIYSTFNDSLNTHQVARKWVHEYDTLGRLVYGKIFFWNETLKQWDECENIFEKHYYNSQEQYTFYHEKNDDSEVLEYYFYNTLGKVDSVILYDNYQADSTILKTYDTFKYSSRGNLKYVQSVMYYGPYLKYDTIICHFSFRVKCKYNIYIDKNKQNKFNKLYAKEHQVAQGYIKKSLGDY